MNVQQTLLSQSRDRSDARGRDSVLREAYSENDVRNCTTVSAEELKYEMRADAARMDKRERLLEFSGVDNDPIDK